MGIQAVLRFGVRGRQVVDFGLGERVAKRGWAALVLVVDEELLADLGEAEMSVVHTLDIEGYIGAGKAACCGGAMLDLFNGSTDRSPAAGSQQHEGAEGPGEAGARPGEPGRLPFFEQGGHAQSVGALDRKLDGSVQAGARVRRYAVGDEWPRHLRSGHLADGCGHGRA